MVRSASGVCVWSWTLTRPECNGSMWTQAGRRRWGIITTLPHRTPHTPFRRVAAPMTPVAVSHPPLPRGTRLLNCTALLETKADGTCSYIATPTAGSTDKPTRTAKHRRPCTVVRDAMFDAFPFRSDLHEKYPRSAFERNTLSPQVTGAHGVPHRTPHPNRRRRRGRRPRPRALGALGVLEGCLVVIRRHRRRHRRRAKPARPNWRRPPP
eukprot:727309-Prymnesium_polylepis.1